MIMLSDTVPLSRVILHFLLLFCGNMKYTPQKYTHSLDLLCGFVVVLSHPTDTYN